MRKKIIASAFILIFMLLMLSACDTKNDQDYFNLGMNWLRRLNYDIAISNFSEAIRRNPNYTDAYIFRGVAWHYKRDYDKAIADFNKAEDVNPDDTRSCSYRANTYANKRNYIKAIEDLESVLRNVPDVNKQGVYIKIFPWEKATYFKIGFLYAQMGSVNKALTAYNKALSLPLNPDDRNLLIFISRAKILKIKNMKDEAFNDYQKAITEVKYDLLSDPRNPYLLHDRGYAMLCQNDFDKAIEDLTNVINFKKFIIQSYKESAYFYRGVAWQAKKNYENAINDYKRAIELDPEFLEAHLSLSWIMSACPDQKFRDGEKALTVAEKALEIVKESTSFLELANTYGVLAAAHAESGDFKKAIEAQKEALNYLDKLEDNELKSFLINEAHKRMASYKGNNPWTGEWYEGRL